VSASTGPRDWDARTYDRVSTPQMEMAGPVLDRLDLKGDETVLDAGCGTGRVTRMLIERLPRGRVIAVDAAPSMVEQARQALGDDATVLLSDLAELELDERVDAVFSNAVFHWVPDHDALFGHLRAVLEPGGRLVAQCGGEGNVEALHAVAAEVGAQKPFTEYLAGWDGPWNFASPHAAAKRLERAGFSSVRCWLEPWPVVPPEPEHYLRTVCLGNHLLALPEELRPLFVEAVAARCPDPLVLEYVRLNIVAGVSLSP
jgi:trans-aconitate 2-methyltransferase